MLEVVGELALEREREGERGAGRERGRENEGERASTSIYSCLSLREHFPT